MLEYLISAKSIKVNRAEIQVIEKLLPPVIAKGIKSFLSYVEFYRRFI